ANSTSTVIFVSTDGPAYSSGSGYYVRGNQLAFYNNSLSLPAGLAFVDDLPDTTPYRWTTFNTYANGMNWLMGNDASMYGGVAPSNWTDNNATAAQISTDPNVLTSLFTHKGSAGTNATIYSGTDTQYSSTNGRVVADLFRVQNTTNGPLTWSPYFYYSQYSGWSERASVAVNGTLVWTGSDGLNAANVPITLPANSTSTVIFVSTDGPAYSPGYGYYVRGNQLAFYNNSLSLPAGLAFVDDLTGSRSSVTLTSPAGLLFDIASRSVGAGQLLQGTDNAFDGLGRLLVGGTAFAPSGDATMTDGSRTVGTSTQIVAGLAVSREVTVPSTGSEDFSRTVDVFTNPTASPITTTVRIVGNLGSDAATTVWKTSDGDTLVETTDLWVGTDDADETGSPAIVHYIHGPNGLQPTSVVRTADNIEWTYEITVPAGETVRLAHFTVLADTQAAAEVAAGTLVTADGFGGQAAAFLTQGELDSIQNFVFNRPPVADAGGPYSVGEGGSVQLDASGTTDPDLPSDTLTYEWDFDNDGQYDATGVQPTFSAASLDGPTSVTVGLRVTDSQGEISTDTATINVANVAPTAAVAGPAAGLVAKPYSFTFSATDPSVPDTAAGFDYAINWGDGNSATVNDWVGDLVRSHFYTDFDTYSITVTATDKDGGTSLVATHPFDIPVATSVTIDAYDFPPILDNHFVVARSGDHVVVTLDGVTVLDTAVAGLTNGLSLYGQSGNDNVTVDFGSGSPLPPGGLTFDGGPESGPPNDTVTLTGGATDAITHTCDDASSGQIDLAGPLAGTIHYTGVEAVTDGLTAGGRDFAFAGTGSGGDETIVVSDPGIAGQTKIDSTQGAPITFTHPIGSLSVNAGDGDDLVRIDSLAADFKAAITIDGQGGTADVVTIQPALNLGSATSTGNLAIAAETVNTLAAIDVSAGTVGQIDISGATQASLANLTAKGSLSVASTNIDLTGNAYQSLQDAVSFDGAVDLASTGVVTVSSGGGAGDDVTFTGAVNDPGSDSTLRVVAGGGDVDFQGAVGDTDRLGQLTVVSADDVQFDTARINAGTAGSAGISITANSLLLEDGADSTLRTVTITPSAPAAGNVGAAAGDNFFPAGYLAYNGLTALSLNMGTGADTVTLAVPTVVTTTEFRLEGDAPPNSPGDTLVVQAGSRPVSDGGDVLTVGTNAPVYYAEFERLDIETTGDVVIIGSGEDDELTVTATGPDSGSYQLIEGYTGSSPTVGPVVNFLGISSLTFNAAGGDDVLIINNPAGGLFQPDSGIFYNGEANSPTPGDTLQIVGGTATTVEHVFTNEHDGFIKYDATTVITYTGLEPVDESIDAANKIFTFNGGAENATLKDILLAGDTWSQIDSGAAEVTTFTNPTVSLTVNLHNDTDTLDVQGLDSMEPGPNPLSINLIINGDGGDTVSFTTGATSIGAGNANVGTMGGQPIQTINFNGGWLQTTGNVSLTAAGAIATSGVGLDVSANMLTASAATGIGSSLALDTMIATLAATNSTSGNIMVVESNGLIIGGTGVRTFGGNGNIDIDVNAGNLTVNSAVTAHGAGTVTLNVDAGAANLNAAVNSSTGQIDITADSVNQNTNGNISTGGAAAINVTADSGSITMTSGTTTTSNTGAITYSATANVALSQLISTSGGAINVTAGRGGSTTGAITDNLSGESANLSTMGTVTLDAETGIGSTGGAADIDTAIGMLVATNRTSGDIVIQESSGLIVGVGGVQTLAGSGHISIDVDLGNLTINDVVTAQGAGTVTLNADNGTSDINAVVSSTSGAIQITGDIITQDANVTTGSTANVVLTADNGAITMADLTTTSTGSGQITYTATANIGLSALSTTGNAIVTADSDLDGAGAISDVTALELANIAANQVALRAGSGIGDGVAPNVLDIDVAINTLAAVTRTGDIHVQDLAGGLSIDTFNGLSGVTITNGDGVATGNDHITIWASSPLTVSAGDPVVNNDGGNITLAAEGAAATDDLTLYDNVTVTGGDGAIDGDGNIYLYAGDTIDLAAATVVVSADASGTVLLSAG
ncbi:MAG: hypothetical protein GX575_07465, partial [Candidatus Anammoximicrobium sp.]|nr:hypothetical protein [Candidatus Anammoximicrobium sp.]